MLAELGASYAYFTLYVTLKQSEYNSGSCPLNEIHVKYFVVSRIDEDSRFVCEICIATLSTHTFAIRFENPPGLIESEATRLG